MDTLKRKYDGGHAINFLTGSANAQRLMNAKKKKEENLTRYHRNINVSFQSNQNEELNAQTHASTSRAEVSTFSLQHDQRQKAQCIADSLSLGSKDVQPSEEDPHFIKIEPNTGIELNKRFVPNLNVSAYLDGRTLIPISTLYSICLPGESDDGKCTIPIDGDWLIMGAIAEKKAYHEIKGYKLDSKGRKIDDEQFKAAYNAYIQRKTEAGEVEDLNDLDNPWRDVQKEVPKTISQTYTLVDVGQNLVNRETAGDSMLMVTVYKADEMRIDEKANRQYIGGSGGAFELMESLGAGTVVCLLNPIITKGPTQTRHSTENDPTRTDRNKNQNGTDQKMIGLKPRRRENCLTIGIAKQVGQCQSLRKDGQKCSNFIDLRTTMRACTYHSHLSTSKSRNGRQEFANSTSNFLRSNGFKPSSSFSFMDGMSSAQSKAYISKGLPKTSTDSRFQMDPSMGRDAEAKSLKIAKEKEADGKISSQLLKNRLNRPNEKVCLDRKPLPTSEMQSEIILNSQPFHSSSQSSTQKTSEFQLPEGNRHSYGSKLIQDALKGMKRSTSFLANCDDRKIDQNQNLHPTIPTRNSAKADLSEKKLDKLLARHGASAQIPIPLMNMKIGLNKSAVRAPTQLSFDRNHGLAHKRSGIRLSESKIDIETDSSSEDDLIIERVVKQRKSVPSEYSA